MTAQMCKLVRAIRCSHIKQKIAIWASIPNNSSSQSQVIILLYIRLRQMCKPVWVFAARTFGTYIAIWPSERVWFCDQGSDKPELVQLWYIARVIIISQCEKCQNLVWLKWWFLCFLCEKRRSCEQARLSFRDGLYGSTEGTCEKIFISFLRHAYLVPTT